MLPRTSRFQSRPAVSAGHTSCWITEHSGLPQKGTDRQVSDNTCKDKTIYSQWVVDTETYMGDEEWATGGGESARDECTPAARSAQIAQSTSCQHNKITGGAEKAPWTVTHICTHARMSLSGDTHTHRGLYMTEVCILNWLKNWTITANIFLSYIHIYWYYFLNLYWLYCIQSSK